MPLNSVSLPDSSTYVRDSPAAYSFAAVVSVDRAAAIVNADALADASLRCVANGDYAFRKAAARDVKAAAALRSSDHPRAFRVVSLHAAKADAVRAADRAARKAYAASLVLPVVVA